MIGNALKLVFPVVVGLILIFLVEKLAREACDSNLGLTPPSQTLGSKD